MSRMPCALPLLTALLLASVAQAGDSKTYRWVDAKGRVHYSDVPAPKSEQVTVKPGSGVIGVPKDQAASAEQRKQNCDRRKEQLQTYEAASTISESDALGNVKTYTAAEREQFLKQARDQVTQACASS